MIIEDKNKLCVGCSACFSVCPVSAIEMLADRAGFMYPVVDDKVCISCNRCKKVCPVLPIKKNEEEFVMTQYLGQTLNEDILNKSASGGVFTQLAVNFIEKTSQAVVVGAAYHDDFCVKHTIYDTKEDIYNLSGSKYVASEMGNIYKEVKKILGEGRQVLFSGTPCQVAGLKKFVGDLSNNLITVDFYCHSVPAPKAFELYIKHKEEIYGKIRDIAFKDKKYGYSFPTLKITTDNKREYYFCSQADEYMKAFLDRKISRECCFNCNFRGENHQSDITLGDYYSLEEIPSIFKLNKGVNRIVVRTALGARLLSTCNDLVLCEVDYRSESIEKSLRPFINVDFSRLDEQSEEEFWEDNFKLNIIDKMKGKLRLFLYKIGVHDFAKKIVKKCKNGRK